MSKEMFGGGFAAFIKQQHEENERNTDTMTEAHQELPVNTQDWREPIPLDSVSLPEFPTSALPKVLADYVSALSTFSQTPPEMGGALALGILATAFQSRYKLQAKEGYIEPINLYIAAIAPPGERKSSVHGGLLEPVNGYEKLRRELERKEIVSHQAEHKALEKALDAAQSNKSKGKATSEDVQQAAVELDEFGHRYEFRLIADDVTPEKLVEIMAQQNGTITLASAEGGIFDIMSGRYDKMPNFDVFLKAHACERVVVDRIGRDQSAIDEPHLTIILTLQPSVIQGNMQNGSSMRGRGLCARFLYVMCDSKVGYRDVNPPPIPIGVKVKYHDFVRKLLADTDSGVVKLGDAAQGRYLQYATKVERQMRDDFSHMPDWGGKLVGAMLRIAALLHCAEHEKPTQMPVSEETVERAARIADCLSVHAQAAYHVMGASEVDADAKYLWKRINALEEMEISKRDLHYHCKGKFKTISEMEPALDHLEELNYLRVIDVATGGRPSVKILVNPLAAKRKNTRPQENRDESSLLKKQDEIDPNDLY